MKQLSAPQIVILLDVLFIFLFILIIKEPPPKTKIILPKNQLENGGFLSHEYEEGKFIWYDPKYQQWSGSESDNLVDLYDSVGKYALHIDCNDTCIQILKNKYNLGKYTSNISVVITNELYDQIARITYMACQTNKKNCGNITFTIGNDWKVDKKKLLEMNPFLKNIPGMVENF